VSSDSVGSIDSIYRSAATPSRSNVASGAALEQSEEKVADGKRRKCSTQTTRRKDRFRIGCAPGKYCLIAVVMREARRRFDSDSISYRKFAESTMCELQARAALP
jgi:hypothetical protein